MPLSKKSLSVLEGDLWLLKDEGVAVGYIRTLDVVGTTVTASVTGRTGTITDSGGAGVLNDISDVTITTPADTEVLTYDSASGEWKNQAASSGALGGLTDVTITAVADNEVLAYDSATSEWINQTATEAGLAASSHTHPEADISDRTLTISADHSHASTGAQGGQLDHANLTNVLSGQHHDAVTIGADGEHSLATQVLSGVDAGLAQKGHVELATAAETTTGTDATRAVTPDGLAGSDYGKRYMLVKLVEDGTALATGDGKFIFVVPADLNGWNLVDVEAHVTTVSTSGTPTYSIYNLTDSVDMLSTSITIDANEYTSATAATPPVIDTANDDVATGDRIEINKDVAGTGEKGDEVLLVFQLP